MQIVIVVVVVVVFCFSMTLKCEDFYQNYCNNFLTDCPNIAKHRLWVLGYDFYLPIYVSDQK